MRLRTANRKRRSAMWKRGRFWLPPGMFVELIEPDWTAMLVRELNRG